MVDTLHDRVGEFRDLRVETVYLRPLGGGREWVVERQYVREASDSERMRASVAAKNERSRNGGQ
jgi:hypothetical protein